MIKALPHIVEMNPYVLADLSVAAGKRPVMLAQNESLRPPSPKALQAAADVMPVTQFYPDPDWLELRAVIGEIYGLQPDHILCGAGSMELIACIVRAYAGPGRRVLTTQYGYAFFSTAAQMVQADLDQVAEPDFTVSVDLLLQAVRPDTALVFVANPGNPTGTRIRGDEIVRLREALPEHVLLVVDEAYGEFADHLQDQVFDLIKRGDTVVLRTFSKAYGLAGMRVGWGFFPPRVAAEVRKLLNPNNISQAGQAAAAAAMRDQDYMLETVAQTAAVRNDFIRRARQMGIVALESFANFVLLEFSSEQAAQAADRTLRAEGILMRSMAGYGLAACLRATVGPALDMELALATLARACPGGNGS